ncbi:hypothetical protein [Microvirga massiliensis]|uniref:hypothetical protein n=1 Tax=Microvirga massiliensis TaxID=1033741 RepID=UPI00062B5F94|nr:hypothetical protein [Microvirga massiliensis]
MPLTYLKGKPRGDNSMSGKPCESEVGYGKNQGGQGCLWLRPYCFNPNPVGAILTPGVTNSHPSYAIDASEEAMRQIHQAWDSSKIERKGWNGSLRTDHQKDATWGSPKAGNGHGDGAIVVPVRKDATEVMLGEGEGWQVEVTQIDAEVAPDGGI